MTETTKARKTPAKPRKTAAKAKTVTSKPTETKAVSVPHDEIR